MAAPVLAPMPDSLVVGSNYTLRVTALDPASGALVAGVKIGLEVVTGSSTDAGLFLSSQNPILLGIGA